MGWSLRRSGNESYRDYLRSHTWRWRRQRWFRDCRVRGTEPACQVCDLRLDEKGTLDLHHVSYEGVSQDSSGKWQAREADIDLLPMCRTHHEQLHKILDQQGRDYLGWNRRRASVVIIAQLRRKLSRESSPKI